MRMNGDGVEAQVGGGRGSEAWVNKSKNNRF